MGECCETCRNRLRLRTYDYTNGGCDHSDAPGFVCLVDMDEGIALWMIGLDPDYGHCEAYERKDDKHGG